MDILILNQEEKSQLNYLVSKTTFSANISLKCSFAKASKSDQDEVIEATRSDHIDKLENEILRLKSKLAFSENAIIEQKQEDNLQQLKELAKSAEKQAAESCEDLLKVKKENSCNSVKNS